MTSSETSVVSPKYFLPMFLITVLAGFSITLFVTYSAGGFDYAPWEWAVGIGMGALYLLLGLFESAFIRLFSKKWAYFLFFFLQIIFLFLIGWILGPGGNWLMGLPLVVSAVENLGKRTRWLVYLGVLLVVALPIGLRYATWLDAFYNLFSIVAAIAFVAGFAQLQKNERQARQRIEALMAELEMANQKLVEYAVQVEALTLTKERNRLAREIHDTLGHFLTVVNMQLQAAQAVMATDPEKTAEMLAKAQDLTRQGLEKVRESVLALRESPYGDRPLPEALAELADANQNAGIVTHFRVEGAPRKLEAGVNAVLYRTLQEALTNVRKHARASRVDIILDFEDPDEVRLTVRDNGIGTKTPEAGFGLLGIQERAALQGGICRFETAPGEGFCLCLQIPTAPKETQT